MDLYIVETLVRVFFTIEPTLSNNPCRGESPVGSWNIKINDQSCWGECKAPEGTRQAIGKVIGFSMTFWGCAKDGKADATIYQIPADDGNVFPPKDLKKPMGNSTN